MLFTPFFGQPIEAFVFAVVLALFAAIIAGYKQRNIILWTFFSFMFVFPLMVLMALPNTEKNANAFIDKNKAIKKLKPNNSLSGLQKELYEKCNTLVEQTNAERQAFNEFLESTDNTKAIDKRCNLSQRGYRQIKKNSDLESKAIWSHYNVMLKPRSIRRVLNKHREIKLLVEHEINRLEGIEVEIENGSFHNKTLQMAVENPMHCPGCGARVTTAKIKCDYCAVRLM